MMMRTHPTPTSTPRDDAAENTSGTTAIHGAPLVSQSLQRCTPDHETQRDWQRLLTMRVHHLQEDIAALMEALHAYAEAYDSVPAPTMQAVAALAQPLTEGLATLGQDSLAASGEPTRADASTAHDSLEAGERVCGV